MSFKASSTVLHSLSIPSASLPSHEATISKGLCTEACQSEIRSPGYQKDAAIEATAHVFARSELFPQQTIYMVLEITENGPLGQTFVLRCGILIWYI